MQNKLPKLFDKHKICVICEGNEEYEYLERLKALKVWDAQYEIIYFAILRRSRMNNMKISNARLMSFMELR